ncbi:MAG TPA: hypothetical protein VI260_02005 [Blastocatellia bacterium]|jgi:hypothetical protein
MNSGEVSVDLFISTVCGLTEAAPLGETGDRKRNEQRTIQAQHTSAPREVAKW